MKPEDLQHRVSLLEQAVVTFSEELRLAFRYIPSDAGSSLTKSRIILERLMIQIYVTEMGHPPKKPLLGDMLLENQFTHKIERRILSRMNAIRDMGNLGPHGESVVASDAARVLEDLCEVLDWYLLRYNPPRPVQQPQQPEVLEAVLVEPEPADAGVPRAGPGEEDVLEILPVQSDDSNGPEAKPQPAAGPPVVPAGRPTRMALLYKRHAKTDEALLKWLESAFVARGYDVFVDRQLGIGVEWAKELDRRIRESDAVIPLISAASVQSEMLATEMQIADDEAQKRHGKPRILPVRLNFEGELPSEMAAVLNRLQYFLWKGPHDNPRLLAELARALENPSAEPPGGAPPTGVLPLHSPVYVQRPADQEMQAAIRRQDSVIRVRGARQVGKTSLLARGIEQARAPGTRVVFTDFQQLNASDLESVETLFRTLGEWLADELKLDIPVEQFFTSRRNPSRRFNQFICQEVLGRIGAPLVWAMDEVDRLFPCPFRSEVFGLFRSWHNARATEPTQPWRRLTLVIAYATEAHLLIENLDQSPFNVGTSLVLDDFSAEQLAELNRRYNSPLRTRAELQSYADLLGGHPYLTNRGLHEMAQKGLDLGAFQAQVERDDGLFNDHLRRLLILLSKDAGLCEVVRGVLRGQPKAPTDSFLRLRSAGVVSGESVDEMRMRCQLYSGYLKRHLL